MNARRRIDKTEVAKKSLAEISSFLADEAGLEVALRVLASAEQTFNTILATPGIGRLQDFRSLQLGNVRAWHVDEFENWLVYYREINAGVEVLDVMHGARDREARLGDKLNSE